MTVRLMPLTVVPSKLAVNFSYNSPLVCKGLHMSASSIWSTRHGRSDLPEKVSTLYRLRCAASRHEDDVG